MKNKNELEDRVTHILSEWLNDSAPLGEENYREPAKAVLKEVSKKCCKKCLEELK